MKNLFENNIRNKRRVKSVPSVVLKNISTFFIKNIHNVKIVQQNESLDVTMIIEIKYQTNERYIMEEIGIKYYNNKELNMHLLKTQLEPMLK